MRFGNLWFIISQALHAMNRVDNPNIHQNIFTERKRKENESFFFLSFIMKISFS